MTQQKGIERYRCMIEPGYVAVSREPALLSSVCGNGVIVILWDPIRRSGGMAHCVLGRPRWGERPTNYHATVAIPLLVKNMRSGRAYAARLEAYIFGGGALDAKHEKHATRIVDVVHTQLKKQQVPVVTEDTFGQRGRKIVFDTHTGDVFTMKTRRMRQTDWAPEQLIGAAS